MWYKKGKNKKCKEKCIEAKKVAKQLMFIEKKRSGVIWQAGRERKRKEEGERKKCNRFFFFFRFCISPTMILRVHHIIYVFISLLKHKALAF